jgi:hypothetical protein
VFEEPGDDKSFFRRVVDKINPFSDDGKKKTADKPPESWQELMAKKKAAEKEESPGFVASFWSGINPFGGRDSKDNTQKSNSALVNQIDDSLQQKGISAESQMAGLKAPAAALPEPPAPVQTMDTGRLLGEVDSRLQKSGREVTELTPPKAAEAFTNPTVTEAALAAQKQPTAGLQGSNTNDLLSSIDQTLNKRGVKSADFEAPPTPSEIKERSENQQSPKKNVEIEPKLALEKGLFLIRRSRKSRHEALSARKSPRSGQGAGDS